jgi:Tol biopolymer transport system component
VAFSVNDTRQVFHNTDPNRVEVFDYASDVVVYDVNRHEIITAAHLKSAAAFETFPAFSPDGKTLFFCSADTCTMPYEYNKVKYSLCAVSFDSESRSFGTKVDTLYNAKIETGKSASFPRVSPDGKFLMFTLSGYGNFSIWHKDADLCIMNIQSREIIPADMLNSNDVESYPSWSSNSRWVVFSSRRIDGLYTRPYIAYINSTGEPAKPFLLPQKDVDFYHSFMKSYNIPEFVTGKVKHNGFRLSETAINEKGIDVTFVETK